MKFSSTYQELFTVHKVKIAAGTGTTAIVTENISEEMDEDMNSNEVDDGCAEEDDEEEKMMIINGQPSIDISQN